MTASGNILVDAFVLLYCLLLVACAATDFLWLRIPNVLVLAFVALFIACAAVSDAQVNWPWHVVPALASFGLGMLLFQFGKMGGGDVKLLAAAVLWIGFNGLPIFLLGLGIGGLVVVLLFLAAWRHLGGSMLRLKLRPDADGIVPRSLAPPRQIPYGVVIAVASIASIGKVPFFT
jgi:prepilin peptidase CpaA